MTSIKRCKSLVGDFYKRFILKDSRYIGYSPCEYLCDRFILSFMYKYSRKCLSEEIIQQVEETGYVTGFNDDHLVKYLCLNIIDSEAYSSFIFMRRFIKPLDRNVLVLHCMLKAYNILNGHSVKKTVINAGCLNM